MSEVVSLQPQNATPLMRAVSLTNAARRPLAPAPLAALQDPASAPAAVLAHLAAAQGVSIWRADWSDDRKRQVIARSIALKRRRGTASCFEAHLGFVDAELVRLLSPPERAVVRNSMTDAEREAWAAQFPELRVYYFRNRSAQVGILTPGRWLAPYLIVRDSVAARYAGARAVIVDRGVERSAVVQATEGAAEFAQSVTIGLPTQGRRFTLGQPLARPFAFPEDSDAAARLFSFRAGSAGPDTLRPGLRPIDVTPTRVAARASGLPIVTAGQAFAGPFRFLRNSRAREAVYDSVRLFEPGRVAAAKVQRRAGFTLGASRLGQPAFRLELAVDLSFRRRKARRFPHMPGFIEAHDPSRTDEALVAVRAAKLGRDKVEIRTDLHRPIAAGDRIPLDGSYRLGQIIRSL